MSSSWSRADYGTDKQARSSNTGTPKAGWLTVAHASREEMRRCVSRIQSHPTYPKHKLPLDFVHLIQSSYLETSIFLIISSTFWASSHVLLTLSFDSSDNSLTPFSFRQATLPACQYQFGCVSRISLVLPTQ